MMLVKKLNLILRVIYSFLNQHLSVHFNKVRNLEIKLGGLITHNIAHEV